MPVTSVAKWPDIGATSRTFGCGGASAGRSLAKRRSVANGVRATTCSCTATTCWPTATLSMPKGSRRWVTALSAKIWCAARSLRTGSSPASAAGSKSRPPIAAREAARAPSSAARCAS